MFNCVQVRTLTGPLKNIYFLLIQPLQCGFSFVIGSLSWWNVNLLPSFRVMADSGRFSSRILLYFAPCIVPSTWQACQSLLMKNSLITWCCHHLTSPKKGETRLLDWYWHLCIIFWHLYTARGSSGTPVITVASEHSSRLENLMNHLYIYCCGNGSLCVKDA